MVVSKKVMVGKSEYFIGGEGNDLFEAVKEMGLIKSLHDIYKCGICGSDSLVLHCHEAGEKKFKYTTVRCRVKDCGGTLNISENMTTHESYYKRTEGGELDWKKVEKKK